MMGLKYKMKSVLQVDYYDLDKFLTERFGFDNEPYQVVAAEELSRNMVKSIDVNKKEFNAWDQEELDEILTTKEWGTFNTGLLLCHLCNLGEIPEGEYLIDVL